MQRILFTTTELRRTAPWKEVRIGLARQLVLGAIDEGFRVVVLDNGSSDADLETFMQAGAHVFPQHCGCDGVPSMGKSRREALSHALELANDPDDFLIWTEPEKHPIISDLNSALDSAENTEVQMIMFNRQSLDSYPPEQAHAYSLVRLAARYLLNRDLDFMFGPVAFRKRIADYWSGYDGVHGDKWDCIHIPKLRALRAKVADSVFETSYVHPSEQTSAEMGNMELFRRRIEQVSAVVCGMLAECSAPVEPWG